jgi:hypothetical protein
MMTLPFTASIVASRPIVNPPRYYDPECHSFGWQRMTCEAGQRAFLALGFRLAQVTLLIAGREALGAIKRA